MVKVTVLLEQNSYCWSLWWLLSLVYIYSQTTLLYVGVFPIHQVIWLHEASDCSINPATYELLSLIYTIKHLKTFKLSVMTSQQRHLLKVKFVVSSCNLRVPHSDLPINVFGSNCFNDVLGVGHTLWSSDLLQTVNFLLVTNKTLKIYIL